MGDWNISVDVSGQIFTQSFQVAEYILPKFRVDVQLPDYGTLEESTTTAIIKATYAYGGPVTGEATISVYPKYKSSTLQPFNVEPVSNMFLDITYLTRFFFSFCQIFAIYIS